MVVVDNLDYGCLQVPVSPGREREGEKRERRERRKYCLLERERETGWREKRERGERNRG